MRINVKIMIMLVILACNYAYAEIAPVLDPDQNQQLQSEEYAGGDNGNYPEALSLEQRVAKLENQIKGMQQLDVASQIQDVQQAIETLRNQLEVAEHEVSLMKNQLAAKDNTPQNQTPLPVAAKTGTDDNAAQQNSATLLNEQNTYENAYNAIKGRKFNDALAGFQDYLSRYSQGHYAVNAHYWIGEIFLLKNQSANALKEFKIVVEQYPKDTKVADAMLKIGFVYYDIGQLGKAKQQLLAVVKKYPDTTIAQLAQNRLRMIAELDKNDSKSAGNT